MPPQSLDQLILRHIYAGVEGGEVWVIGGEGGRGVFEGEGEDVDGGEEVGGEGLDGEIAGGQLFGVGAALEVDEVCAAVGEL